MHIEEFAARQRRPNGEPFVQVGPDGIHSGADVNGPRARRALHGKGDRRDPDERQRQARHGLLGQLDALPLVQLLRGQGGAAAAIVRAQGLPGLLEGGRHAPVGGAPAGPMHQPGIVGGAVRRRKSKDASDT